MVADDVNKTVEVHVSIIFALSETAVSNTGKLKKKCEIF
jgi:hypothetical protein